MPIGSHQRDGTPAPADFFGGDGEMRALVRSLDWSKTPIGAVKNWSPALRLMVDFMLANRFPLLLWWGPQYTQLYNDAHRPVLGTKHPRSLGQAANECWPEIWHILEPLIDTPFNGGPATWSDDLSLEPNRHGFLEETHFTVAYSAVPDDSTRTGIGGVLVHEITEKVLSERRIAALRDLAARPGEPTTAEQACEVAATALSAHTKDIPFAVIYLLDASGKCARLAGATGVGTSRAVASLLIELDGRAVESSAWPLSEVLEAEAAITVEQLRDRFSDVPAGPWPDRPDTALIVPIKSNVAHRLSGFFVAATSPRLRLDGHYRSFLELAATQISTAISNARTYEEERQGAEALGEINRAKTLFFSNVSHEFRTPLTLMMGPLEEALATPVDRVSLEARAQIKMAHASGLRLLKLVNALLDFSRIEAGHMQASYEPVDLAAWTAELASTFRSAMQKAGLPLVVDCRPLPEPVFVDRDMWENIVLNLVSNAFKFTLDGEIVVSVRLSSNGQSAELTVQDSGAGIPEHELPRLFERFHRVEGVRGRSFEGSGIGLALVQELVKLHGGSIRVESKVGRGSSFTVSIPFGTAHLPAERIRGSRDRLSTAPRPQTVVEEALRWLPEHGTGLDLPSLRHAQQEAPAIPADSFGPRPRILVADDNADMRDYLCHLLGSQFEVIAVPDGEAAFAAAQTKRPALVLSDVMMPRLDGFGLVTAIRADKRLREVPIILLSARAGDEAKVVGLDVGADDYLVKPFSARELVVRVQTNLRMSQIRKAAEEALRKRTTELEAVVETVPTAVWFTYDREARRVTRIRYAADLLRLPADARNASLAASRNERSNFRVFRDGQEIPFGQLPIERAAGGEQVDDEELELRFRDGDRKTLLVRATTLRGPAGQIHGAVCAAMDITDRKRHAQRQLLLLNELNHRVKNTLATIQSIAMQTLRNAENTDQARRHFEGRLMALSSVHNILTREQWEGASLPSVIADSIAPFRCEEPERFETEGPDVSIPAKYALALAMALHELCTNAVKYGALSNEKGHIRIEWTLSTRNVSRQLTLRWTEMGGPPVKPPSRRGFGSRLIELGLKQGLAGDVRIDFASTGLSCTIEAPLPTSSGGDDFNFRQ
jgi:signal transduction histidine kinase/DNA-binding response OmpR family regulator